MGRAPCCSKVGLHRGPWSTKEDTILISYIQQHGEGHWRSLPKKAGKAHPHSVCLAHREMFVFFIIGFFTVSPMYDHRSFRSIIVLAF